MTLPGKTIFVLALITPFTSFVRGDESEIYFEGDLKIADVARFNDLPTRFYLRPEFQVPVADTFLQDEFLDLFVRILDGDYDDELYVQAARSLERVSRERLASTERFADVLRKRLKDSDDRDVRRTCAMALAAAESKQDAELLASLCQPGDEVLCLVLEEALSEWKSELLLDVWQKRIQDPTSCSQTLLALACQGVASLNATQVVPELQKLIASDRQRFSIRKAAAQSLARLSQDAAYASAEALADGTVNERIVAATLLDLATSDGALSLAEKLCDDEEDAVASIAWNSLVRQDPDRLLSRLTLGQTHQDPNVRSAVVRTILVRPTVERCDLLSEILGDFHLGVRNESRRVLQTLAEKDEQLRARICTNAGGVLGNAGAVWQQVEQSLLLLGHLRHDAYQADCLPLLKHERPEVLVTAAWLLHVMPQDSLGESATSVALANWKSMKDEGLANPLFRSYDEQLVFLLHVAGFTHRNEMKEMCEEQFDKASVLDPDGRAVAMWALGMLNEGSKDDALAKRFVERVFDDNPFFPEFPNVKNGSALALGLVGSTNSIPDLRRAHTTYGVGSVLGNFVSTALRMLGEEPPPYPKLRPTPIQNWPIHPAERPAYKPAATSVPQTE